MSYVWLPDLNHPVRGGGDNVMRECGEKRLAMWFRVQIVSDALTPVQASRLF